MVVKWLKAIGDALLGVLVGIGRGVVDAVPGILAAILLLLIGYWVALAVEWAVKNGLEKLKTDQYLIKQTGLGKTIGNVSVEWICSFVAKWYTFVLFFMPAADVIGLPTFASFLKNVASWVPTLIGASLLGLFGVIAAGYVRTAINETKLKSAKLVADFFNVIILVVTALVVLKQVGLDIGVVENSLFIILSGVMLALALALGLGFGLALKDEAKRVVKDLMKRF